MSSLERSAESPFLHFPRTSYSISSASTPRSVTPSSIDESSFEILSQQRAVGQHGGTGLYLVSQGHPGRSAIWRYFKKIEDENGEGSICYVPKATATGICGARKSRNINVLRNHLKGCDPKLYDSVMAEDEDNNRRRQEEKVLKALQSSSKKNKLKSKKGGIIKNLPDAAKYNMDNQRQKMLDKTVAVFVGASNTPYSIVGNEDFRTMLQAFDPRYRIPGRSRLMSLVDEVLTIMKVAIQEEMASARKINFCADIWTKKGLTSSYLGLTSHYFCPAKQRIQHATLAVRILPHPHTGEAIYHLTNSIIGEWGIPITKVQYIITDNGSNMVKAFKKSTQVAAITEGKKRGCEDDCDSEDEGEESENEEESEEVLDREVDEFVEREESHSSIFADTGLKRLSCFSHTLQLVTATFNKDPSAKALLSRAYKVVKQVSMSGKATEALIAAAGKKLVSHSVTRWSSAYLVIRRLLEVKDELNVVLLNNNMTMLQPEDWVALSTVKDLLSKFAIYTNVAGGEVYPTLSLIIAYYVELQRHLEEMKKKDAVANVADIMLKELQRRFGKLLDSDDKDHDPIFMVATMLDPRFKMLLEPHQILHAKKECLKHLLNNESDDDGEPATTVQTASSAGRTADETEPPRKRLKYVTEIIEKKATEKKEVSLRHPKLPEIELDAYIQSTDGMLFDEDTDPIRYWSKSSYKILSPFAIDLLSAPASSTPVERTFSTAGIATSGRRNRLASANLEKEVLLKKNKEYYESTI